MTMLPKVVHELCADEPAAANHNDLHMFIHIAGAERFACHNGSSIKAGCQCSTVDKVVVLADGADAKGRYVSLSRARDAMHVYTRNKPALRQSVMELGERKSVWELLQAVPRSKVQSRDRMMPDLWATRQAQIIRAMEMER